MELQGAMIRLQEAAVNGNVDSLLQLLSEYPKILDFERCYFKQSTLNVALKLGRLDFANTILVGQPELAETLCIHDSPSLCTSALHICAEKGYVEMVQLLLNNSSASRMCLAHDSDGRNPLHLAAIHGHQEVLRVLIEAMPMVARELTSQSHGADEMKYRQLEILAFLLDEMNLRDLLNSTDIHGNTLMYLAVSSEQSQMVKYLTKKKGIALYARNKNGSTAMDICAKNINEKRYIRRILGRGQFFTWIHNLYLSEDDLTWLENNHSALLVVATLIVTMAFQLGVNPPGGVWQDNEKGHVAGESILAFQQEDDVYPLYLGANIIAFVLSSLSVLLLILPGEFSPPRVIILRFIMLNAVIATMLSYYYSLLALFPSSSWLPATLPVVGVLYDYPLVAGLVNYILLMCIINFIFSLPPVIAVLVKIIKKRRPTSSSIV